VISLVDDVLIEQMRKVHCDRIGEPYEEITDRDDDPRAHRITAYMDLLDRLVREQVVALQASPFEPGSEITRYFEMLPDTPLKRAYHDMRAADDPAEKARMQAQLRQQAVPGCIDANIMTKLDCDVYRDGTTRPAEHRDALAALRGFALSTVRSGMVFSAGMNQRLFRYVAEFDGFYPDESGAFRKRIILKVSDYRSALIQAKFLAKLGLWVSEYRIESGLNCGGHAFPTKGLLLGPILDEFRTRRDELFESTRALCLEACRAAGRPGTVPREARITVQGGISTPDEDQFLLTYYHVDGTGWATPFLLVPEVVTLDDEHFEKLRVAGDDDVYLSDASPLNVSFWNLRTSGSEEARHQRIREGRPGSACRKSYVLYNTEVTQRPTCIASRAYQRRKLEHLAHEDIPADQREAVRENVVAKACICHDLGGGATRTYGIDPDATPAVCPGPNIAGFSKLSTFREMLDHIYGRLSGSLFDTDRPHMFITELRIYIEHLRSEIEKCSPEVSARVRKYFGEFRENLLSGIESYRGLAQQFIAEAKTRFLGDLARLAGELEAIPVPASG
ncbi:hypothetical protein HQ576_15125, partial [bacterium]|nr:hypothetical protein [bacterium]